MKVCSDNIRMIQFLPKLILCSIIVDVVGCQCIACTVSVFLPLPKVGEHFNNRRCTVVMTRHQTLHWQLWWATPGPGATLMGLTSFLNPPIYFTQNTTSTFSVPCGQLKFSLLVLTYIRVILLGLSELESCQYCTMLYCCIISLFISGNF